MLWHLHVAKGEVSKIAKEKGKFKGRVAKIDVKKIQSLKEEGLGATEIARQMGIERTSVYRLLKKVKVSS